MEVARIAIGAGAFGFAAWAFFSFTATPELMSLKDVTLQPMGAGFAVTGTIRNPGGPDRLTGIGSDSAGAVMLVGGDGMVVPAGSEPKLAMDGAHGMLTGLHGESSEGRLVPITLWFEKAGRVSARGRVSTAMMMDHGQSYSVGEAEPSPTVSLTANPNPDGWTVEIISENFAFSRDSVDGPHEPGIGHGHLYLNGLKLQRVYQSTVQIGALPAGDYEMRVTLNTNDHRAYTVDGRAVSATLSLTVD